MRWPTLKWHVMLFKFRCLFVFICLFPYCTYFCSANAIVSRGDSTCLSSWKHIQTARYSLEDKCDATEWKKGFRPDPLKTDFSYCTRKIITDLSPKYTPRRDFKKILYFIRDSMGACLQQTNGHNFVVSSFDPESKVGRKEFACCSMDNCKAELDNINPDDYLADYYSNDLVSNNGTFNLEYAGSWIDQIKQPNWQKCASNSMIFITNRIINLAATNQSEIYDYFTNPLTNLCVELTVILVGREDATKQKLQQYYSKITTNLFVVPDLNCLDKLSGCILPCINKEVASQCLQEQLSNCPEPTFPTTTLPPTTSPVAEQSPNSIYLMYVFSLSDKLSLDNLQDIKQKLINPIHSYELFKQANAPVTIGFYLPYTRFNSPWFTNLDQIKQVSFDNADLLQVSHPIDTTLNYTVTEIEQAITHYQTIKNSSHWTGLRFSNSKALPQPMIILLTDYISEPFILKYYSGLKKQLENFDFRIYCYNNAAYEYFKDNNTVDSRYLYRNNVQNLKEIPLDSDGNETEKPPGVTAAPIKSNSKAGISEGALVGIIVGSVIFFLILLIIGTILYRQKMTWMRKIDKFRSKHEESEPSHIMEDYWELSWDRLMIKSEKIGSGAYGQVFRGKVHGKPPCVDHFYSDRPHLASTYDNCDCAIKMLPKYATDSARKEFMNEIELMKTIGYNDNIVNMLGCITVGQSICLVLEYCPNRDLLQYVKALKVDVNISKSMDVKINYTKEFMLFAWQIVDGMRFLSSKHIIHRDLAARNILIDGQKNAKISDFGLCIILDENYQPCSSSKSFVSASGRLPIKWLSLEALTKHEFSSKSDVWSFGMLLFEMYSFGETPFNDIPPRKLAEHLQHGNRPEKPTLCPEDMYNLMQQTWKEQPEDRPTFQEILTQLTVSLERATEDYGYIKLITAEEYTKLNKLALAKSFNGSDMSATTMGKAKKKGRIFTSSSNVSDHHKPPLNHKPNTTVSGKISKRHSHSSNHIQNELEKSPTSTP